MAKSIRFDYFKVYARSYNETREVMEEGLCDLTDAFNIAAGIPITDRVFYLGNDQARLQSITFNNNMWELHFLRIRKKDFPLKTHDDGTFGYFDDLSDEEGFGEEVSALYNPQNMTIMIRRNSHSLSPSAISNYFTALIDTPGFTVFFKPLVHPRALELLRQDHLIRGAEISVADVKNATPTTKRSLGRLVSSAEEIDEAVNIVLKVGLEQKGSRKYSKIPIFEELEAFANDENVRKAEVRIKADEDAKVENFDLISNRLYDYHLFSDNDINEESRNVLHSTVISTMHRIYRVRLNDIENIYE